MSFAQTRKLIPAVIVFATCVTAVGVSRVAAQKLREALPANIEKADQLRKDLREMVSLARDKVFPSLVNIQVITVRYYGGKEHKGQATGSGTIISPEGHVLTNFHVARNGKKFTCTLADKQEIEADLVGEDPLTDLAILKLRLDELVDPGMTLPVAKLGDSDELNIGDTVMAMGSPWALSRSVTLGIVSNTERILASSGDDAEEMRFDRDQRTGIFNRWIQHDSAISPGSSGGPLVNLKGEVVGVNARGAFFGGDMGFAIPSNIARTVAANLIEHNEVPRSWFGWTLKPIKKSGHKRGVLINSVVEDGPAGKAGLDPGDVVIAVDGGPLTVWFPEEEPPLLKKLADYPIGSRVEISFQRDGEPRTTTVVTERLTKDRGDEKSLRAWGLVAVDITDKMARNRRLESTDGVLVSGVRPGGPAQMAEPPLARDDVIRSVGGEHVADLKALQSLYDRIMGEDEIPEYLLIEFSRKGRNHLTMLKPRPDEDVDPPREVPKAWIGVAVQPVVKKLARQLGNEDAIGFRVTRVYPRTLAADTGLRIGDLIVALNGERLRPRGMQDAGLFHRSVRRLEIDEQATLSLLRGEEELAMTVMLERTRVKPDEARRDHNRDFEIVVREVTFFDRDENRWPADVKGVIILKVERAGWAQLGGVRADDLIQRIDKSEIHNLTDYREAMKAINGKQPERIAFVVLRGSQTRFQYVEPDWERNENDKVNNSD